MSLLRTAGLTVRFGGLTAVNAVDLTVEAGQLVGLIGPNGAGKTTMIDAITGFVPSTGRIEFAGREIESLAPHRRAALGLGRTWQSLDLFDDLTVEENLQVAADRHRARDYVLDLVAPARASRASRVRDGASGVGWALDLLGLSSLRRRLPRELSNGQRTLVAVARALAARPTLVCMDEPAAGLDTGESAELGRRLREVVGTGTTILLVDHDMSLVLGVCDMVHVIEFGVTIAHGAPSDVSTHPRVIEAYLGSSGAPRGGES